MRYCTGSVSWNSSISATGNCSRISAASRAPAPSACSARSRRVRMSSKPSSARRSFSRSNFCCTQAAACSSRGTSGLGSSASCMGKRAMAARAGWSGGLALVQTSAKPSSVSRAKPVPISRSSLVGLSAQATSLSHQGLKNRFCNLRPSTTLASQPAWQRSRNSSAHWVQGALSRANRSRRSARAVANKAAGSPLGAPKASLNRGRRRTAKARGSPQCSITQSSASPSRG